MPDPQDIWTLDYARAPVDESVEPRGLRVEGDCVAGPRVMELPAMCVMTGSTNYLVRDRVIVGRAGGKKWVLVALFGVAGLFASRKVADKGSITFYLSEALVERRRQKSRFGLIIALIGIAVFAYGLANQMNAIAALGVVAGLAGFIVPRFQPPNLRAVRVDEDEMYVRGFGEAFLQNVRF